MIRLTPDLAARLLGVSVFVQLTAWGANGDLLGLLGAVLNLLAAAAVLSLAQPGLAFYRRAWPVLLILATAIGWATAPELAVAAGWPADAARPVPDMAPAAALRAAGMIATLLAGAALGYRRGRLYVALDSYLICGALNLLLALVLREVSETHVASRFAGTLANANAAGAGFGFVAALALGRIQALSTAPADANGPGRLLGLVLCPLILFISLGACLITTSRSAGIATLAGLLAMLLLQTASYRKAGRSAQRSFLIVALGVIAVALVLTSGNLLARIPFAGADAVDRAALFRRCWDLAMARPWFGYGLGSYTPVNLQHLANADDAVRYAYINAAHNQLLQLALVGGLPFLGLHLLAGASILATAWRSRRSTAVDPMTVAAWTGLGILLGCSMIDIALTVPALTALAAGTLGLLWGRALRRADVSDESQIEA